MKVSAEFWFPEKLNKIYIMANRTNMKLCVVETKSLKTIVCRALMRTLVNGDDDGDVDLEAIEIEFCVCGLWLRALLIEDDVISVEPYTGEMPEE